MSRRRNSKRPTATAPPRDRLLAAAVARFYRDGIGATGIDRLLAESDVAKASLYQHFGSKAGLVNAYVAERERLWDSWFAAELAAAPNAPIDRMLAIFDILRKWFEMPDFAGCAFIKASHESADAGVRQACWSTKLKLRAFFAEMARAAKLPHAAALAEQLALLVDGAIVAAQMSGEAASANSARRAAVALIDAAKARIERA